MRTETENRSDVPESTEYEGRAETERREFIRKMMQLQCSAVVVAVCGPLASGDASAASSASAAEAEGAGHGTTYGMGIQVDKCIGCGKCVAACKQENDVPEEPFFFRTWVERYVIHEDDEVTVDSPEGGIDGFEPLDEDADILRSFFVPKLCNQCDKPPCVQVCPVGATFKTEDGVVLVDEDYCIGCRYCIQACPYGARYLDPRTKVADKCTFCYHRIKQGLLPACVEVCPTGARVFGDLEAAASPLRRLKRMSELQVLKPSLNTEPKVKYSRLDGEVI